MVNKKIKRLYTKLFILVLCLLIISRIFVLVLSRYENLATSYANVDIAFYLLKEDYKEMKLNLGKIVPQNDKYIYEFTIGNQDGIQTAEIDLEYELKLRTTTNLPLKYELFMNQKYTDINAQNIIKENIVSYDEHQTYFRNMTTDKIILPYTNGVTNLYQLVIHFPENYNQEKYQDIIELLEITVDAKQVVDQQI